MGPARYITLLWPGLPWLWLRGSIAGLVLSLAFAVAVDMGVLMTFIWTELVDFRMTMALWTATGALWLVSTASAIAGFPPPLPRGRSPAVERLFVAARDAYLARDWLAAETTLRGLLAMAPLDGEAQLLWGTLLRRVGRLDEAEDALTRLSRSDAGAAWKTEIARELRRIATARRPPHEAAETRPPAERPADRRAAA